MRAFAVTGALVAVACQSSEASSSPPAASPVAIAAEAAVASLPPPETKCATNDDCAATNLVVSGEGTCCYACAYSFAGTKRWVEAFEASCPKYLEEQHRQCAGLRCRGGLITTECSAGTCRINGPSGA